MKKILFITGLCMVLSACGCKYNKALFHIDPSLPCFENVKAHDKVRETDGSLVVNITGMPKEDTILFYRVVWFDENNIAMNTLLSRWNKTTVLRNMPFNWSAVAPSSRAKHYKVYISDRWVDENLTY